MNHRMGYASREIALVGRTRYQEVRKRVEMRIRENDLVRQWGVVWSTNPR